MSSTASDCSLSVSSTRTGSAHLSARGRSRTTLADPSSDTAATDASGIAYYRLHRSTSSGFAPGPGNEIAQTTLTSYSDSGNGASNGLPAGTYFYKLVAVDSAGNAGSPSGQGTGAVTADTSLPRVLFGAPTPASLSTVSGTVTLSADATPVTASTTVGYGFDAAGFRRSRTVNGTTTRFLLGGMIETTASGTITGFDVDGPAGDLAHYSQAPSSAVNPSYSYYSGHGDLAAEANHTGARTRLLRLDPWGKPVTSPGGSGLQELYTGRWDKKHDLATSLIEMGARPYDPALGRFLSVDPVDGGSASEYDYARQEPVNSFDLTGEASSNAYTIADGGDCGSWAACTYWRTSYDKAPVAPSPLWQALDAAANYVAKYGGSCAVGAITGGLATGGTGALIGCGAGVALEIGKRRGGRVRTYSRMIEGTLLTFDVRRIVYNRLGVPTYREIIEMYRAGAAPRREAHDSQ